MREQVPRRSSGRFSVGHDAESPGGEDPHRPRGLRGEESIAELCRREGLAPNLYYRWSKEFLEAGKKRLLGDTKREAADRFAQPTRSPNELWQTDVATD